MKKVIIIDTPDLKELISYYSVGFLIWTGLFLLKLYLLVGVWA